MIFMPSRIFDSFSVRIPLVILRKTTMRGNTRNVAILPYKISAILSSTYGSIRRGDIWRSIFPDVLPDTVCKIALSTQFLT